MSGTLHCLLWMLYPVQPNRLDFLLPVDSTAQIKGHPYYKYQIHDQLTLDSDDLPFLRRSQLNVLFEVFSTLKNFPSKRIGCVKKIMQSKHLPSLHLLQWTDTSWLSLKCLSCLVLKCHFVDQDNNGL